jgi:hypothetical protein
LKPAHFVPAFLLLFALGSLSQSNIPASPNLPVVPKNTPRRPFPPLPKNSWRMPAFAAGVQRQSSQITFGFANAVTFDTGGFQAEAVAAADLNGDGKPDLVVVNACGGDSSCAGGTVGVLLNNGSGAFGTAVTYATNGWLAPAVAVADVNGDGKPDIVVSNNCASDPGNASCSTDGNVAVLLGNGDGTFHAAVAYDSGGFLAQSVAIADVNGDGKPDLMVVNRYGSTPDGSGDGTVAVLLSNGDGTFQAAVNYDTGALQSEAVAVADVNGDGKPDLVVANMCQVGTCDLVGDESGSVSILLGMGDGTFTETTNYRSGTYGTNAVAVADINGDGKLDIAVSSTCEGPRSQDCGLAGVAAVFLGNGDGTFQYSAGYEIFGVGPGRVRIEDVNGDGKPDLVVSAVCATAGGCISTTSAPSAAGVLLGNGDGTFQTAQYFGSIGYSYGITPGLAAADLTGNGNVDLIVTSWCADASCSTGSAEHSLVGVLMNTSTPVVLSPPSITFPNQYVGTAGASQTVTLTNTGSSAITVSSVATSTGDFGSVSSCGSTVAAGSSCSISISFDPTQAGSRTGVLTVTASTGAPSTVALTGTGQDFSLTPSSPTATVMPGSAATYAVAVAALGGFNQTVAFSCSGAPAQSTCSVSPTSVTLNGSTSASVNVTVSTAGSSANLYPAFTPRSGSKLAVWAAFSGLPGIALVGVCGGWSRKRRGRILHGLAMLCLLSAGMAMSACGSGSSNKGNGNTDGTPVGTYNLTLTGSFTSGSTSLAHTSKLTLVVQ